MILRELGTAIILVIVVTCVAVGFGSAIIKKQFDGPIEEACEAIIEDQLNLPEGTIDLTPGSIET